MGVTIKLRGDTAANWTAANPVLKVREIGLELDTKKYKVGDGTSTWDQLEYWGQVSATRLNRMFGDDNPNGPIDYQINPFETDDPANNVLGFETPTTEFSDSYNPPAPFSKNNSGTVEFYVKNHHLKIYTLTGNVSLVWNDSTPKNDIVICGQFAPRQGGNGWVEIRVWDIETPDSSSPYWAVRFIHDQLTYPQYPWRAKLFSGSGITYSLTDGTEHVQAPWDAVRHHRCVMRINLQGGANGRCQILGGAYISALTDFQHFVHVDSSLPSQFKRMEFSFHGNYERAALDSIRITS